MSSESSLCPFDGMTLFSDIDMRPATSLCDKQNRTSWHLASTFDKQWLCNCHAHGWSISTSVATFPARMLLSRGDQSLHGQGYAKIEF